MRRTQLEVLAEFSSWRLLVDGQLAGVAQLSIGSARNRGDSLSYSMHWLAGDTRENERECVERDYFAEWWPPWIYFGRHRMGCGKPDSEPRGPVTSTADRIFSPPAATERENAFSHTTLCSTVGLHHASPAVVNSRHICYTRLSNSASIWLLDVSTL